MFSKQCVGGHQTASVQKDIYIYIMVIRFPDLVLSLQHLAAVIRDQKFTENKSKYGHFIAERWKRLVDSRDK